MCVECFVESSNFLKLFFILPGATLSWLYYLYFLIISQIYPYLFFLPLPLWISPPDCLAHHLAPRPQRHPCTPTPHPGLPFHPAPCRKSGDDKAQSRFYLPGCSESLNSLQRSKITPGVSEPASISHATTRSEVGGFLGSNLRCGPDTFKQHFLAQQCHLPVLALK